MNTIKYSSSLNLHLYNLTFTHFLNIVFVVTLALGSRPRQGLARLRAKREAQGSHFMFLGVQKM